MTYEIKQKYFFAFDLASIGLYQATKDKNDYLSEDEISLVSLHLVLALERLHMNGERKNVVIICSSGKATSQLISLQLQKHFKESIQTIQVLDEISSRNFDYSTYDFVLTTIDLLITPPVSVYKIPTILTNEEMRHINNLLINEEKNNIYTILNENLFFNNLHKTNKKDLLKELVINISTRLDLPENFYDSIIEREKISSTDIGNLIAIPHPNYTLSKESFVSVCVLPKSINWGNHPVQVVFLLSLSEEKKESIDTFYKLLLDFSLSSESVTKLLKNPEYSTLITILESLMDK